MSSDLAVKKYEFLAIYTPDLSEEKFKQEVSDFRAFLEKETDSLLHEEVRGLKRLAYRIKKAHSGYFVVFQFSAKPESLTELRTHARLNTVIVRSLFVSLPESYDAKTQAEAEDKLKKALDDQAHKNKAAMPRQRVKKEFVKKIEKRVEKKEDEEKLPHETLLAGKDEKEKLQSVEKTLESILENPDITV